MKQRIMPKVILLVISAIIISSCGGRTAKNQEPELPRMVGLGPMPVVINNSSSAERHIWIFEGLDEVKLTRDPRTGKMAFDRIPIGEIRIDYCNDPNRHKYTVIYLPKNTSYRIYEQPERIIFRDPIGRPFSHGFRLGSNPYSQSYSPRTPTMSTTIPCAHYIELPHVDHSSQLRFNPVITINPREVLFGLIKKLFTRKNKSTEAIPKPDSDSQEMAKREVETEPAEDRIRARTPSQIQEHIQLADIEAECWGMDLSDGKIGGWKSSYPHCILDDGGGDDNAIYDGELSLEEGSQLSVIMRDLSTKAPPSHILAVGFRITLKHGTFYDGSTSMIFEMARFTGRPSSQAVQKYINIQP